MTVRVNLLPEEYVRRKRRAARFRMWIAACASLLVIQLVSAGLLQYKARETRAMLEEITARQSDRQVLEGKSTLLSAEQKAVARQIALACNLRKKHRWSRILAALTASLPKSVVLTNIESYPPRPDPTGGHDTGPKKTADRAHGDGTPKPQNAAARGLKIDGLATDHESIADLLQVLNDNKRVGTCQLQSTILKPFMNNYAVTFTIHTRW